MNPLYVILFTLLFAIFPVGAQDITGVCSPISKQSIEVAVGSQLCLLSKTELSLSGLAENQYEKIIFGYVVGKDDIPYRYSTWYIFKVKGKVDIKDVEGNVQSVNILDPYEQEGRRKSDILIDKLTKDLAISQDENLKKDRKLIEVEGKLLATQKKLVNLTDIVEKNYTIYQKQPVYIGETDLDALIDKSINERMGFWRKNFNLMVTIGSVIFMLAFIGYMRASSEGSIFKVGD